MSIVPDELPEGWSLPKFGELLDFKGGSQPPKSEFASKPCDGYVRLLQIRDFESDDHAVYIKDSTRWPKCETSDIMVGRYGASVGKVLSGKSGAYNVALVRLVIDQNVTHTEWVKNYLVSDYFQKPIRLLSRSAQNGFNKEEVEEFDFPLPPLPEQRRIVAKIEALQSRSRKAREALEAIPPLLEQFRQSVLAAAFRGDLTADWREQHPEVEPASVLLDRIRTERRHKWEASELSKLKAKGQKQLMNWQEAYDESSAFDAIGLEQLPKSWCWCRISDVGHVQLGRQRAPKYHSGTNMRPYLRVMNVYEDRIDTGDVMEMDFSLEDFERYKLSIGDILLNEGQSHELVGRSAIYGGEVPGACFTNTLVRFRPDAPITSEFPQIVFLGYLKSGRFQQIASLTVNIAHLGAGRFAEMGFPLPPLQEQIEIVRRTRAALEKIKLLKRHFADSESKLTNLDQSILAKAFRGELVPQDPDDEPASQLLERIQSERADDTNAKPTRGRRKRTSAKDND